MVKFTPGKKMMEVAAAVRATYCSPPPPVAAAVRATYRSPPPQPLDHHHPIFG